MNYRPIEFGRVAKVGLVAFLAAGTIAAAWAVKTPASADAGSAITAADYARAERFMPYNANLLVLRVIDRPKWLPSGRFWYRTRTERGFTSYLVDPTQRTRRVVFDQQHMARFLRTVDRGQPEKGELPFDAFELSPDETSISFLDGAKYWSCDAQAQHCTVLPFRDENALLAPDRTKAVFIRDHNLWVRDMGSGREVALTTDGSEDFGYATDNSGRRRTQRPVALWSPDSKRVATFQQDERGVGNMYLVKAVRGHPQLDTWKYAMAGDAVIPTVQRVIVDVDAQRTVRLTMPPDLVRSASWLGLARESSGELEAQWTADGTQLTFVSVSRDHKCAWLRVADARSGAVRTVVEECTPTFYESAPSPVHASSDDGANWRYLESSNEVIWYSARSDWGHLYLYDAATGRPKNAITTGKGNVVSLVSVDERQRAVYFTAVGREAGRNPYFEHLYRVGFDGTGLTLLTPEDAMHVVSMAPSREYFVDTYSRVDAPPVSVLRERNGKLVQTLETADIDRLSRIGWKPPLPITVKARDGVTDLYGLMFRPSRFDATRKYPIVNAIYSAPIFGSVIRKSDSLQWGAFAAAYGATGDAQSLAELGFVVVMIDGMGTPLRSRTFHETYYANYGDATLPDQLSAMQQLAQRYPWIDLDRAGIYGASNGGYAAARAMLAYPDFFKVGVAISGNHDLLSYMDEYMEKFMGLVRRTENGSTSYDRDSNMALAANLKGHLLLVHGTMDENVSPYHTLLLSQALIEANKDFDLLMLPNQTHASDVGVAGRYMVRRSWDYFVRHLLGTEPPLEYEMHAPTE